MTRGTRLCDFYGLRRRRVEILRRDQLRDFGRPLPGFLREVNGILGIATLFPEPFHQLERILKRPGIVRRTIASVPKSYFSKASPDDSRLP